MTFPQILIKKLVLLILHQCLSVSLFHSPYNSKNFFHSRDWYSSLTYETSSAYFSPAKFSATLAFSFMFIIIIYHFLSSYLNPKILLNPSIKNSINIFLHLKHSFPSYCVYFNFSTSFLNSYISNFSNSFMSSSSYRSLNFSLSFLLLFFGVRNLLF
jgi:hypothetical protein